VLNKNNPKKKMFGATCDPSANAVTAEEGQKKNKKKKKIKKRDRQKIVPRVNAKRLLQALTI
jgi:uncharacterized protein YggU (UPF0235/DUF167 family)